MSIKNRNIPEGYPIRGAFMLLALFFFSGVLGVQAAPIVTPNDTVPDFCANPTKTSVASGDWSNKDTWSGGSVPGFNDIVLIAPGTEVRFDASSTVRCVGIKGKLYFKTDANTSLKVGTIMVYDVGKLWVGTSASPVNENVTAEIVIADQPLDMANDPNQYGTGLLAWGEVKIQGATKDFTFSRLADGTHANIRDTVLHLADTPTTWKNGDRIIVPDSKQWGVETGPYVPMWDEATIQSISGNNVTLQAPLQFDHPGAVNADGNVRYLPHIGNLTRNVVIRSENPSGTRGHVLFTSRADVDIEYALFKDLGRTTWDPLDPVTNHLGRYPLHVHHLMGPYPPTDSQYQYRLIGNAIDGGTASHRFKWGITVHDSHYGWVKDNVIYNMGGAGLMTEDGSESFNVFEHNFAMRTEGTGEDKGDGRKGAAFNGGAGEFGYEGSAFWFRGTNNYVRKNVGVGSASFAYTYLMSAMSSNPHIPKFRGADTSVAGDYDAVSMSVTPVLEFSNNEAYGSKNGLTLWDLGSTCCATIYPTGVSLFQNTVLWNIGRYGMFGYGLHNVTLDGWTQINDKNVLQNGSEGPTSIHFDDYQAPKFVLKHADIENVRLGVQSPLKPGGIDDIYGNVFHDVVIQDSLIRANYGIVVQIMTGVSFGGVSLPPRRTLIQNVKFGTLPGYTTYSIVTNFPATPGPRDNIIQKDQTIVTDYNQISGNNFQVYYPQQAPSAPMFAATGGTLGCPHSGLTAAGCLAQDNVTIAGEVAPCTDQTSHPEIGGFVCPLGSIPPPPPSSPCDVSGDGTTNVSDVQLEVNYAIGAVSCVPRGDINHDSACNVIDVQRVVNAALGGQCVSP